MTKKAKVAQTSRRAAVPRPGAEEVRKKTRGAKPQAKHQTATSKPRLKDNPKMKAGAHQTKHRIAASNPEVKKLLVKLMRTWKRSNPHERRRAVAELLAQGCTIHGIAEDAHVPASTVRLYSKTAAEIAENDHEPVIPETALPRESNGKTASEASGILRTSQKEQQSSKPLFEVRTPTLPGKSLLPEVEKPDVGEVQTTENSPENEIASSEPLLPPEEPIESMQKRPHEILVDFIRAELWGTEKAADPIMVGQILEEVRIDNVTGRMNSPNIETWPGMKSGVFIERIKQNPLRRPQGWQWKYIGQWGVRILLNLIPDNERLRSEAIDKAEQILLEKKPTKGWDSKVEPQEEKNIAVGARLASPIAMIEGTRPLARIAHVDFPGRSPNRMYEYEKRHIEAEARLHPGRRKPFWNGE